jgi:adenylate kinase
MKKNAILLIGPTGSGKTPLGNHIAKHGLSGIQFAHFDFGEQLRQAAGGQKNSGLSTDDIAQLQTILQTGALLEKETFYLAEQIISHFNSSTTAQAIVLNGLPRHIEQARDISPWFDIRFVIRLRCDARTVIERIQSNSGNDRTHRVDDELTLVQKKLTIFETRTAPLCEWFSSNHIPVFDVVIEKETSPADILQLFEKISLTLPF